MYWHKFMQWLGYNTRYTPNNYNMRQRISAYTHYKMSVHL